MQHSMFDHSTQLLKNMQLIWDSKMYAGTLQYSYRLTGQQKIVYHKTLHQSVEQACLQKGSVFNVKSVKIPYTCTHPLNGPFSGTTRVSWYQKGKTNLDFTEARDSEWQWHINWAIGKSAPCSRQITTPAPHHAVFYRPDALPAAQPTASKH